MTVVRDGNIVSIGFKDYEFKITEKKLPVVEIGAGQFV